MISEYGKQIKSFFHFMFKHLFEYEFGIRVSIEIIIYMILIYMLSRICCKAISKIKIEINYLNRELIVPLRVRFFEKLAFSTNNPNWQERANKIKETFKETKIENKKDNNKKSHMGWWVLTYIVLTSWIIGFHYYGEEKRKSYEVFFAGENAILEIEAWTIDTLFATDEQSVECFFHNKVEVD